MIMRANNYRKGLSAEIAFFLIALVVAAILTSAPQKIGQAIAADTWGELKVQTMQRVKNTLLLIGASPGEAESCVPVTTCNKIAIGKTTIQLWGPEDEEYLEPTYLSTSLSSVGCDGVMVVGENGDYVELGDDEYFITTCGSESDPVYICFRKAEVGGETILYIEESVS